MRENPKVIHNMLSLDESKSLFASPIAVVKKIEQIVYFSFIKNGVTFSSAQNEEEYVRFG